MIRFSAQFILASMLILSLLAIPANAQPGFTEYALTDTTLNSDPSTDFWIASAAPADVDSDGDLDLLIAGYYVIYNISAEDRLVLYRNDGAVGASTWALTPVFLDATGLNFSGADIAWGDYDNDGDEDAVVASIGAATLYRNDAGTLTRTPTLLPTYYEDNDFTTMDHVSVSWADFDNDGDADLLIPTIVDDWNYAPPALLRNDGPGTGDAWTFTDVNAGLPIASNAVTVWSDMEGDGDVDLLFANVSPYDDNFTRPYRNDGGTLAAVDTLSLAQIRYGTTDWGDVDADGDLDIVYAGNVDLPDGTGDTVVQILFSDGAGGYTPFLVVRAWEDPQQPWLDFSAVSWADYDSDGDVDLLISGEWLGEEITGQARVYTNDGTGTFSLSPATLPAPVAGNAGGAFTWFDVDSDGDLDYFVAGGYYVENGGGLIEARTQLFRNDATAVNAAPLAAGNLAAAANGDAVTLSWSAASDDDTPATALTYDIQIVPSSAPLVVGRALPQSGSVRGTSWSIAGLANGTYRWSVRAVDSAYNGGEVLHGTFAIGGTTSVQPPAADALALSRPYPNPFRTSSRFVLSTPVAQNGMVAVYDVTGRRVALVHDGPLAKGDNSFSLSGARLASGVYFIRASVGGQTTTRRITLIR